MLHKAVFLDHDGTIIEDNGYISKTSQVQFVPGSIKAIKILKSLGYKIIVISNQSGVAQGFLSEKTLQNINNYLQEKLKKNKASTDGIYYCPHHPGLGKKSYKKDCNCRKPKTGLLKLAVKEHKLTLKGSVVIGDKLSDVELAKNAKLKSILVLTGYGRKEFKKLDNSSNSHPDYIASNLLKAAQMLEDQDS